MIERALEAEMEQHRAQISRVREEITAQVSTQVTAQVAEQMSAQMQAYEAKIRQLVDGSRVVTSEPEVTNVMAPAHVIYRSSIDSRSDDVNVEPNDDHNEDQPWISVGHKSFISK
ncbi:hypothetical protein FH972_015589 [Carpinus fangiana]|uniref:Uncharacterized protein n=1 Tax=Carpinus fangiana TaxID=176857 RepID=A0A5N6RD69_9ROSI|nr:hypothetical protein FH972_015589 [Carpinus fangiana]